jgi:hypothetical protein
MRANRLTAIGRGGAALSLTALIVLGCSAGTASGPAANATAVCKKANAALLENINATMIDPADAISLAYVAPASNLQGPPVVTIFEDPVWVAAKIPGGAGAPPLWLAEGSGHGFAYVANDAARAINFSGIDVGPPPIGGDGKEAAIACATS